MTDVSELRPGDIFTTPTYGAWYDRIVGEGIRFATATRDQYGKYHDAAVNHAGLYLGDGKIIEAAPGGAHISDWDSYGDDAHWSTNGLSIRLADGSLTPKFQLTDDQRAAIVERAKMLVGTPYGFLDIVAVGFAQQRLGSIVDVHKALAEQPWWVRKVMSIDGLICSQLVDFAFSQGDVHLFQDGRLPGLVSPVDLYGLYA